jgi:hypothetical protein
MPPTLSFNQDATSVQYRMPSKSHKENSQSWFSMIFLPLVSAGHGWPHLSKSSSMELLTKRCGVAFQMLPVLLAPCYLWHIVLPTEETELYCQAPPLLQSLMATTRSPVCPFGPAAHTHSNDLSEMSSLSEHIKTSSKEPFRVLSVHFLHFPAIFKPLSWIRQELDPSQCGREAQWFTHPIAPSIGTVFPRRG